MNIKQNAKEIKQNLRSVEDKKVCVSLQKFPRTCRRSLLSHKHVSVFLSAKCGDHAFHRAECVCVHARVCAVCACACVSVCVCWCVYKIDFSLLRQLRTQNMHCVLQ